ncbi:MAG: type II secretion system protein [Patescibacteria group bacterium]|nr:type II secretion system protein [Patescibacteria group bacterium]
MKKFRGYTLVELIVAVGLFALVMVLASGAYLIMIGANRQAQSVSTGINNLSFALESMTRTIRTGSGYNCAGIGDCVGGTSFSLLDENGATVTYSLVGSSIQKNTAGVLSTLTDPSVTVSSLTFYAYGTKPTTAGDYRQARVTIIVSGTVSSGPGKTEPFTVETGATMRGSDL